MVASSTGSERKNAEDYADGSMIIFDKDLALRLHLGLGLLTKKVFVYSLN